METSSKRTTCSAVLFAGAASGFLDMKAEIGDLEREVAGASDSTVMILTCPECATSYFVDDSRISPAGRTVKCSSCGARWTARPQAAEEPRETPPAEPDFHAEPAHAESASAVEAPEVDDLTVEEAGTEPEPVVAPPPFMPRKATPPRRQANGRVLVLAAAAAAIAALVAAAAAFRDQVVQWLPASQAAYAGL